MPETLKFFLTLAGILAIFGLGALIAICAEARGRGFRIGWHAKRDQAVQSIREAYLENTADWPLAGPDQDQEPDEAERPLPADAGHLPRLHLAVYQLPPTPYPRCRRILSAEDRLQADPTTEPEDHDATR
jgi:hypothetical protein